MWGRALSHAARSEARPWEAPRSALRMLFARLRSPIERCEGVASPEFLAVDTVAAFHLPVLLGAPGLDVAVANLHGNFNLLGGCGVALG